MEKQTVSIEEGIDLTMAMCRVIYNSARKFGFDDNQAMALAYGHMDKMLYHEKAEDDERKD